MLGHTFTIREASGKVHVRIFIQGNGGNVRGNGSHERMQLAIEQATNGQRTSVYEVRPGIVLGFNETAHGRSNEREIDLRGATIVESVSDVEHVIQYLDWNSGMKHMFIAGDFNKPVT